MRIHTLGRATVILMLTVLTSICFSTVTVGASVAWDGSGYPDNNAAQWEYLAGSAMGSKAVVFQPDTDASGPAPGTLYQNTIGYDANSGSWAVFRLKEAVLTAEVINSQGWNAEFRINVIANETRNDGHQGVHFRIADDIGGVTVWLKPDGAELLSLSNGQNIFYGSFSLTPGFHTYRLETLPGQNTVTFSVVDQPDLTPIIGTLTSDLTNIVSFGDGSSYNSGIAEWDFVALNTEASAIPAPLAVVGGGIMMLCILRNR